MSKPMRVFCLLAAIGLIAAAFWLFAQGLRNGAFTAALLAYPLACIILVGEVFTPMLKVLPNRPYNGESRAELVRRDLEDIKKAYPDARWPARYPAIQAALVLGFLAWFVLLLLVFPR